MTQPITSKTWAEVKEGDSVTQVTMEVPFAKVILDAAATQDYFPGHHNPDYAKGQGQKTIYLNTMAIEGFIDRVATDWAGPRAFIVKRTMSMNRSIYAGDTMSGGGTVTKCYEDNKGRKLVDLAIIIGTQDNPCVPAQVTLRLP
ncbi:MAG: hypothetical protein ACSLE5_01985 [Porticoccaceae bacterium]